MALMGRSDALNATFVDYIPCHNQLGENVLWHPLERQLYWVDIQGKTLWRWSFGCTQAVAQTLPERMVSFAFMPQRHCLLAAFTKGLARYNVLTGDLRWLTDIEPTKFNNRLNDGKCDPYGRFWIGSMNETTDPLKNRSGALYCASMVRGRLVIDKVLNTIGISNGLCFSASLNALYHTDSPQRQIFQYQMQANQTNLCNKTAFTPALNHGVADGATVDKDGWLWSAMWGAGKVIAFDHKGNHRFELNVPASQPSCVCIGGPNMDLLFITTAKEGVTARALDGNLLIYQLNQTKGVHENFTHPAFYQV